MRFLKEVNAFYGTGERNKEGENLEEFLEHYDPKKYDNPSNTTDIVVVKCREKLMHWGQPLEVLLVKRSNHPSIGCWATPGGFVELKEDLETGAARELEEETGVKGLPLQQMYTWGNYNRDPRWRVITTSFLALAEGNINIKAGDDAADALWMSVELTKEEQKNKEETEKSGRQEEIWKLILTQENQGIFLSARVSVSRSLHPILAQERYVLLSSSGLAVDHGCIITQALLYLKQRLEKKSMV